MIIYRFACHDCEVMFEEEFEEIPENPPTEQDCPKCGQVVERDYSNINFHDSKKKWGGKRAADEFLSVAKRETEERLTSKTSPYARYNFNMDAFEAKGEATRLTDKEMRERNKVRKKLTQEAYDKVNKDPSKEWTNRIDQRKS